MFKKKSGQAAFEFMMTYGWALMVITITMGVFFYTQITPKEIVGPSCVFTDDIECFAHSISTSRLDMELKNNAGRPIEIVRVECIANTMQSTNTDSTLINPGAQTVVDCDLSGAGLSSQELTKVNVIIYYTLLGQEFPRTTEGNVIGYVP